MMNIYMNPQVIIITEKNDLYLNRLINVLRDHQLDYYKVIDSRDKLKEIETENLKGFFIFSLPPSEIKKWLQFLDDKLLDYFKIYSYNYLLEDKIDTSVYLNFDFIIAGEQENSILHRQIDFLKSNYWRKVPLSKLGLKKFPDSKLIGRLLQLIEKTDIDITSFDQLSKKLNVSTDTLRREIRRSLKIQYPELRSFLLNYYRENFPEKNKLLMQRFG